jgi:hypothetical protein
VLFDANFRSEVKNQSDLKLGLNAWVKCEKQVMEIRSEYENMERERICDHDCVKPSPLIWNDQRR